MAENFSFQVVRSYPALAWLAGQTRYPHIVGKKAMAELSGLTSPDKATDFITACGFEATRLRVSDSAHSISIAIPPSTAPDIGYHAPQIVLPKIGSPEIPFGTVLMNCLMPETREQSEAERVYKHFQGEVLKLSSRLRAYPFACLTGLQHRTRPREYDIQGYRFFFGPEPDKILLKITDILKHYAVLTDPNADPDEIRKSAGLIQESKFVVYQDRNIGDSIIEDIKPYPQATTLVDLRKSLIKRILLKLRLVKLVP